MNKAEFPFETGGKRILRGRGCPPCAVLIPALRRAAWLVQAAALIFAGAAVHAGGVFELVSNGRPAAEFVVPEPDSHLEIEPWLRGAEMNIPGEGAWTPEGIEKAEVHGWSRVGIEPAVNYFNEALERCAGVSLPVVRKRSAGRGAVIFKLEPAGLKEADCFRIDFPDDETMLITGSARSVRWALNHLLEEYAGVRWLFKDYTHYPRLENLAVPRRSVSRSPSYNYRRFLRYYRPRMLDFYLGLNDRPAIFPRHGTHNMVRDPFPVLKYALDGSWPEEIMPVYGGRRLELPPPAENARLGQYASGWHPCFSNPATAGTAAENLLEQLAGDPERRVFGLGVNDRGGHCQCADCLEAAAGKTNTMGYADYSDVYFRWVNALAEKVTGKYPEVYFEVLAYREVFEPPGFDLHPNVIPFLAIDVLQMTDAGRAAELWGRIGEWGRRAEQLGVVYYAWGLSGYALPRVYYALQEEFIKKFHQHGGAAVEISGWAREGSEGEGPKIYLAMKLLWDCSLDAEDVINDWIVSAVGERSAPFLRDYFRFWEDYWTGDDIRQTEWFKTSISRQYMRVWDWNRTNSATFALKEGDMAGLRRLMEQAAANTETPQQAERAKRLMLAFEYYECNAYALFSEIVPPDGEIDIDTAMAMIEEVPRAFAHAERRDGILERIADGQPASADTIARGARGFNIHKSLADVFSRVGKFAHLPGVKEALSEMRRNPGLPEDFKAKLEDAWRREYVPARVREYAARAEIPERPLQGFKLDGKLDDEFWEGLPVYELQAIDGGEPEARTFFRAAWADDGIYFGVWCEEPVPGAVADAVSDSGDRSIFEGNAVELLIETQVHSYYQIAVSPAGAVVDLDRSDGLNWDWSSGATAAAHRGEGFWSVELRVPVDPVEEFDPDFGRGVIGARPDSAAPWRFNLCRLRVFNGERQTSAFSPTGGGFHVPERFAELVSVKN